MRDFALKETLHVLHIRQSSVDLEHYSCWAKSAEKGDLTFDFAGMELPDQQLRRLGNSFVNFGRWAFGPSGIRSLRLLAYGDFCRKDCFHYPTLLLCRRVSPRRSRDLSEDDSLRYLPFREVRIGEDTDLWELFERESHMLAACPRDA